MRCANVDRPQHSPFRIIPHRGQVPENTSKPSRSEHWGVFHEDESWSNFANDPSHLSPHSGASAVDPGTLSGCGDVLAWESSRDDIHASSPWSPVEGLDIIPDREWSQDSVVLSLHEDGSRVGHPLDRTDCAPPEKVTAENSASSAAEKCQLIHCSDPLVFASGSTPIARMSARIASSFRLASSTSCSAG